VDKPALFDFSVINANAEAACADGDAFGVARFHGLRADELFDTAPAKLPTRKDAASDEKRSLRVGPAEARPTPRGFSRPGSRRRRAGYRRASRSSALEYKHVLDLGDVPQEKLQDGGIWFVLYRLVVFPHASHTSTLFYDKLVPNLNNLRPVTANASDRAQFRKPLRSYDASHGASLCEAVAHAAVLCGSSAAQADAVVCAARLQLLKMAAADCQKSVSISASDAVALDEAGRLLASDVAAQAVRPLTPVQQDMVQDAFQAVAALDALRCAMRRSADVASEVASTRAASLLTHGGVTAPGGTAFPLFGRFRRDASVEHLAGGAIVPPIQLPVELSSVPDRVTDYNSAANAMRRCLDVCTLLANQAHLIKHTSPTAPLETNPETWLDDPGRGRTVR
jgi:hypothetical protein